MLYFHIIGLACHLSWACCNASPRNCKNDDFEKFHGGYSLMKYCVNIDTNRFHRILILKQFNFTIVPIIWAFFSKFSVFIFDQSLNSLLPFKKGFFWKYCVWTYWYIWTGRGYCWSWQMPTYHTDYVLWYHTITALVPQVLCACVTHNNFLGTTRIMFTKPSFWADGTPHCTDKPQISQKQKHRSKCSWQISCVGSFIQCWHLLLRLMLLGMGSSLQVPMKCWTAPMQSRAKVGLPECQCP